MAGEAGKNRTVLLATEKAFAAGAVAKIESVVNDAKYTLKFYGSRWQQSQRHVPFISFCIDERFGTNHSGPYHRVEMDWIGLIECD